MNPIFVTGGTGYIGQALIRALLARDYGVHALVRQGSKSKLPPGALPIVGDVLDESTYASAIPPRSTLVHLVGTPHPNPSKAAEFRNVDLASIRAAIAAAQRAGVRHLVYVSVAHPAPVMRAYIAARLEGESAVQASGIAATIVRPWYVLGPGHRWPYVLVPFYAVASWLPATREIAQRLALVTLPQMTAALLNAIKVPPQAGVRIVDVPAIKRTAIAGAVKQDLN